MWSEVRDQGWDPFAFLGDHALELFTIPIASSSLSTSPKRVGIQTPKKVSGCPSVSW